MAYRLRRGPPVSYFRTREIEEVDVWESKVAPLSGVLFGGLLVSSYLVDANTDFMPPPSSVVANLADGPAAVMASAYLRLLAAAALVWFGGSLYKALRADDDDDRLPVLAVTGATLAGGLLAVGAVATVAAAERVWITGSIDPGAAASLFDIAGIATGNGAPLGFAVMIGAAGVASLRARALPAWVGWSSVALAVALLSPYAWLVVALVIVWVPAAGYWIYRAAGRQMERAGTR